MTTQNQKVAVLLAGGTVAAALIWLRYAKSAARARSFMDEIGQKANRTLDGIQNTLITIEQRTGEVDRFVHELLRTGKEQKAHAEEVISDTLKKLDQTAETIQRNLTTSSSEITELLKEIRSGVGKAVAP
jgi:methyl-accepting chemotaxis protein